MFGWKMKPVGQPHSVIDVDTEMQGPLKSRGYMEIRGRITGQIEHEGTLVIAAEGHCLGGIHASELIICGEVHGDVSVSGKLQLKSGGRLVGDALCGSLAIEPGATFNGRNSVDESIKPTYAGPEYARQGAITLRPLELTVADRGSALRILSEPVDGPALDVIATEPDAFEATDFDEEAPPVQGEGEPATVAEPVAAEPVVAEPPAAPPAADEESEDGVVAFHGPFRSGRFGRSLDPHAAGR